MSVPIEHIPIHAEKLGEFIPKKIGLHTLRRRYTR